MKLLTRGMTELLLLLVLSSGCVTVGPDYTKPEIKVDQSWHAPLEGGLQDRTRETQRMTRWWASFEDPLLSNLIERALADSLTMKEAIARLREARARLSINRAGLFPSLSGSGSASKSDSFSGNGSESESYSFALDASWELDIFGSVRRSVEAAEADFQASEESFHDVLVSLIAEVALNYIELRTYQSRLASFEQNLTIQEQTYQLTSIRGQTGLEDSLAVEQARINLESTRSQLPDIRTSLVGAMNRLAVLLGKQPGNLNDELTTVRPVPIIPSTVSVSVPAELLGRRADIRKAERDLAAQTARVGVATAELYPRFTINGSLDLHSSSSDTLFSSDSSSYSFGPRFSWPIFKAGSIRKNIEMQSALQEQALINYKTTILNALEEVENALVAYAEEQNRWISLNEASIASQNATSLARQKYESGLTDFDSVLDSERSLNSYTDQRVQSEGKIATNLVRLYKALGGGWTSPDTQNEIN